MFTHTIFITVLGFILFSHFAGEEIKAQRSEVHVQVPTFRKQKGSEDLRPESLDPELIAQALTSSCPSNIHEFTTHV